MATNAAPQTYQIPDLAAAVLQKVASRWKTYPARANRASSLGHPCERYLTYKRVAWDHEEAPTPTLLSIFAEGNLHEDAVIRALAEAGFKVIEQQRGMDWPEHQITGMIDGRLVLHSEAGHPVATIPIDVKSCSSYTFESITTAEDMRTHKYVHVRSWYAQMVLYALLHNSERGGLIIMKDKATGLLKVVEVPLDYAYAEELVQKADRINAHVRAGTLPDRIPYDEEVCGRCSFFSLCLPDEAMRGGVALLEDPELLALLRRRLELAGAATEYEAADRKIKERIKQALPEGGSGIIGTEWVAQVKLQPTKGYMVEESVRHVVRIQRLGKTTTKDDA